MPEMPFLGLLKGLLRYFAVYDSFATSTPTTSFGIYGMVKSVRSFICSLPKVATNHPKANIYAYLDTENHSDERAIQVF
jgi:hypothetical protein